MPDWSSQQYLKFASKRTRPTLELLSRVPADNIATAVDLGCGPGNSTVLIKERFPNAEVIGIDSSPQMLAEATRALPDITFIEANIDGWHASTPVDLIFANAALQWVGSHEHLLPYLVSQLNANGILAFQVPRNFEAPTHMCMREIAANSQWCQRLENARNTFYVKDPAFYYNILSPLAKEIDIWETEYFHVMNSVDDIVEWVKGTGLRPFLDPLTNEEQREFTALYRDELLDYYPPQKDGKVIMPFRRLFAVCSR